MNSSNLKQLLLTTYANFKRNKVRTFLTSLGITIGVMSVVLLNALGLGLKNFLEEQFESLGSNLIIVFPGNVFNEEGGANFGSGFAGGTNFDEKDYQKLSKIPEASYVTPVFFKSLTVKSNKTETLGYIQGVDQQFFELMNINPIAGQLLSRSDFTRATKNVNLGYVLSENLFDSPENAIGKTIIVSKQRYRVVGVVEKKGDREQDNSVIVSYKTTFGKLNPDKTFFTIYLGAQDEKDIEIVKQKTEAVLSKRYEEDSFSVTEQTQILGTINQVFTMLNGVLVAIGSISLIVGGIGIMNIMYSTVTERTKEIGIRRAVGATQNDILFQFLSESVILSIFGGFIGLLISSLIVLAVRSFFPAAINLLSVILAVGVSTLIGVFFGVFPAKRAAKLTPLEAIRYE